MTNKVTSRLRDKYKSDVMPAMVKRFGYKNRMQVPSISKIVINMGLGEAIQNPKILDSAQAELMQIAGQKPVIRKARRSIANFKLREGMPIGCSVTLRRERMWEFLDRLVTFALPRVRDFKGISRKAFDGHGNYSLGLSEQLVFPELNPDKYSRAQGMNISIVTTADKNDEARALLRGFGMPFRSDQSPR